MRALQGSTSVRWGFCFNSKSTTPILGRCHKLGQPENIRIELPVLQELSSEFGLFCALASQINSNPQAVTGHGWFMFGMRRCLSEKRAKDAFGC